MSQGTCKGSKGRLLLRGLLVALLASSLPRGRSIWLPGARGGTRFIFPVLLSLCLKPVQLRVKECHKPQASRARPCAAHKNFLLPQHVRRRNWRWHRRWNSMGRQQGHVCCTGLLSFRPMFAGGRPLQACQHGKQGALIFDRQDPHSYM